MHTISEVQRISFTFQFIIFLLSLEAVTIGCAWRVAVRNEHTKRIVVYAIFCWVDTTFGMSFLANSLKKNLRLPYPYATSIFKRTYCQYLKQVQIKAFQIYKIVFIYPLPIAKKTWHYDLSLNCLIIFNRVLDFFWKIAISQCSFFVLNILGNLLKKRANNRRALVSGST